MRPLVFQVHRSPIAGLGAFARSRIRKGARIVEYMGERIGTEEADVRYAAGPTMQPHVLLFTVNARTVIDAGVGGNEARFINHSCEPNCEAIIVRSHVWIRALRDILPGEELTYDYNLTGDEHDRHERMDLYAFHCGAKTCRGTMFRVD
jgi:SET domain-containing protein